MKKYLGGFFILLFTSSCHDKQTTQQHLPAESAVSDTTAGAASVPQQRSVVSLLRPGATVEPYVQNEDTVQFFSFEEKDNTRWFRVKNRDGAVVPLLYEGDIPVLPARNEPVLMKWSFDSVGLAADGRILYKEKVNCFWRIPPPDDEATTERFRPYRGRWTGAGDLVEMGVGQYSMVYYFHGQCAYEYPLEKSGEELLWIWQHDMDCKFDVGVDNHFGQTDYPKTGKPFAKINRINDTLLHIDYLYPDWVAGYGRQVEPSAFPASFHLKKENDE